jgi:hypothetical protein
MRHLLSVRQARRIVEEKKSAQVLAWALFFCYDGSDSLTLFLCATA